MQGIYIIKNKITNQVYVGQSVDFLNRKARHLRNLKEGNYKKFNKLYPAINQYGLGNFEFIFIEECTKDEMNKRELYWIDYYNSIDNGYNLSYGKGGGIGYWLGKHRDQETIVKISNKLKGTILPEEVKKKIGESNKVSMIGNKNGNKKVICNETNQVFSSVKEAASYINRKPCSLSTAIKKNHKCAGYTFRFLL